MMQLRGSKSKENHANAQNEVTWQTQLWVRCLPNRAASVPSRGRFGRFNPPARDFIVDASGSRPQLPLWCSIRVHFLPAAHTTAETLLCAPSGWDCDAGYYLRPYYSSYH